jgi:threonylcarbamoyladenosine tRNA methylthiotransferase MtaB
LEILDEAKKLINDGHRELVVTGVNISTYDDEGVRIAELISQLTAIPGDFRIRLSSMEPHEENKKLITLIKNDPKICRFLHVPLQHGANEILKAMGRPEESAKFADFINEAADEVPGIHLGTDIIVGFPGETAALFEKSFDLLSKLPLANIHVFTFSAREGTPAAKFANQTSKKIAKGRAKRLKELSDELAAKFAESQKGQTLDILIEKKLNDPMFEGWSDNYLRATVSAPGGAPGDIVKWKL